MQRKQQGLTCAVFLLSLYTLTMLQAIPARAEFWNTADDYWALMFGYGQSFPGWGQTEERVHSFEFAPRYSHLTIDGIGSGWWAGRHDTLIELPLTVVGGPGFDTSAMAGLNLLAAYTFTADDCWQPYVFGGGGILYSFADIPGMGAHWNGNYQFAGGLRYQLDDLHALLFEARYHHISNAGSADPNVPLNGIRLMIGYAF
ncbi:acyloxyacyl hydrolase [Desulfobulbus oralis]|nr:acyloxyacyl hydrolase [Desulfobulbus oralis]